MSTAKTDLEVKLLSALKRIAKYDPPDRMYRTSERLYGLDPREAIDMAYENVIAEAKNAIRGVKVVRAAIKLATGE